MRKKHNHKPPKAIRLMIISAIIAAIGGILLIGIPGALILELTSLAYDYYGMSPLIMTGDSVWPTAIMISLLWPLAITPLSFLYNKLQPHGTVFKRWVFSLFGSFTLTFLITFLLCM